MNKRVYGILALGMMCASANAQILFSNGATVHINSGATVITNGGTEIANASNFTNNGSLTVTKNSITPLPGNFTLTTGSTVNGNGTYRVEQDWINDATFTAGTSTVELFGNTQQFITSTTSTATTFNNLQLTGTGAGTNRKKTLQAVNATTGTSGVLTINDRELETQTNTFFVLNTAASAVTNTTTPGAEGFVSSLAPGFLSRNTNAATAYLFPTGSSLGTLRYRPIEVTPTAGAANTYTVRMNNTDPTLDGFDRSVNDGLQCTLNNLYYHSIERASGITSADIKMHYIPGSDGTWEGMAHWRTASGDWNDMSTMALGTSGVFSTVTRTTWLFTNAGHPYVLTNVRPETPVINCPTICENTLGNTFTLTGSSSSYTWTVPASGTIVSGQGTSAINVDWTTGTGPITVYAVGVPGCNSLPATCTPTVQAPPVAGFTAGADGTFGDSWQFTDTSAGATSWSWAFGDGNTATTQNPLYQYSDAGTYTIILTVSNGTCTDTATLVIDANGGIVVPNVFSPNGDGINDGWFVLTGNLAEYDLQIFNRWGQLMFGSTDISQKWDGNYNGTACVEGTYYYVLKAKTLMKDYSQTGALLLVRQ
ncbi:MAG TPA: gliding motility-associated C-terminal domain-containing protein [Flavobacteriales bacterium]|nr:gliding motility-associated C-terminal domain-containing protein [Flavobacteriales bacterium]